MHMGETCQHTYFAYKMHTYIVNLAYGEQQEWQERMKKHWCSEGKMKISIIKTGCGI